MSEAPVETPAQRGRPRPEETVARDERVLAHITANGVKSRPELATELDMPGNQVYLSLWRLNHSDPPRIVKVVGNRWGLPGAQAPAPVE